MILLTACGSQQTSDTSKPVSEQSLSTDAADTIPVSHVHSFSEWTIIKNATCTEPGEQERLCSCGEKQTQKIAATGHTFGKWTTVKDATCTEPGEQERLCSCGEKQTQAIAATGHTFGEWTVVKDATCTENGEQERVCICGEKQTQPIVATGHTFGEWKIAKHATCTATGEEERVCICGEKQTRTIAAKGHSFGEWTIVKKANCISEGAKEHKCSSCGYKENEKIAATGHNWKEATCTKPKTCTVCGETNGSALGHTGNIGEKCSRCGQALYPSVILPKTPINYNYGNLNSGVINQISYNFNEYGNLIILELTFNVTLTKHTPGFVSRFLVKLYDKNGIVLDSRFIEFSLGLNETGIESIIFSQVSWNKTNTTELRVEIEEMD